MLILIMLCMLIKSSFGSALILDEARSIKSYISNRDFNRLSVEGDKIVQVFLDQDQFDYLLDEQTGQLFFKPKMQETKYPLSLTITTVKKKVQGFLFTIYNRPSRALIVKEFEEKITRSTKCTRDAVKLIKHLIADEALEGMKSIRKPIPVDRGWKLNQIKKVDQDNIIGHVLVLENKTRVVKNIEVAHLWKESVLAISVGKQTLKPDEKTNVYIVTDENGLTDINHKTKKIIKENAFDWYFNRGDSYEWV